MIEGSGGGDEVDDLWISERWGEDKGEFRGGGDERVEGLGVWDGGYEDLGVKG